MRGGVDGRVAEREEGSERDADEGDAVGVDGGTGGDGVAGGGEGVEPERDVDAVGDSGEVGALGAGAVKVVWGEEGDAGGGEVWGEAVGPPAYIAAGPVEEKDCGDWFGGFGGGFVDFEAYGFAACEEGFRHGDWMQGGEKSSSKD